MEVTASAYISANLIVRIASPIVKVTEIKLPKLVFCRGIYSREG